MTTNKLTFDDFDYLVPHHPNKRMVEAVAKNLEISMDKILMRIEDVGNTSAACIPLTISSSIESGKLKGNERLLLSSIGAGFSTSTALMDLGVK
jgi:3-oxoacyl-[acyl-carrier-protein] synthase-3